MNIRQKLLIALSLCLFIGCKKSKEEVHFNGTYKGKFIDGPANLLVSVNTQIKFIADDYEATNGTGKFKIEDSSKVKFNMTNIEAMDYVANKVLHGEYRYVIKGDSLILNKIFPPIEQAELTNSIRYENQYRLKRMK